MQQIQTHWYAQCYYVFLLLLFSIFPGLGVDSGEPFCEKPVKFLSPVDRLWVGVGESSLLKDITFATGTREPSWESPGPDF